MSAMVRFRQVLSLALALVGAGIGVAHGEPVYGDGVISACNRNAGIDQAVDRMCSEARFAHGLTPSHIDYSFNATRDGVELVEVFFPVWNSGHHEAAVKLLDTAIAIVNASTGLQKRGAMVLVEDLSSRAKAGELPTRFQESDYDGSRGCLSCFVTQPIWDACNGNADAIANRFAALGASFDARRGALERVAATEASIARMNAEIDFSKRTHGRTFDPTRRPSEDSGYRDAWDDCNRIYEIFKPTTASRSSSTTVEFRSTSGSSAYASGASSSGVAASSAPAATPPRKVEPKKDWYWDGDRTTVAEFTAGKLGAHIWKFAKKLEPPPAIPAEIESAVQSGDISGFVASVLPRFARLEEAKPARHDCYLAMLAAGRAPRLVDEPYIRVLADLADLLSCGYQSLAEDSAVAHHEKPKLSQAAKEFRSLAVFFGHPSSLRAYLLDRYDYAYQNRLDRDIIGDEIENVGAAYMRIVDKWLESARGNNRSEFAKFCGIKCYFDSAKSSKADQYRERQLHNMEKLVDAFLAGSVPLAVLEDPDAYIRRCTDILIGQSGFTKDPARARSLFSKVKDRERPGALHFLAMDGEVAAQLKLAEAQWKGSEDIPQDHASAEYWFRAAARQGDATAVRRLAEIEVQIQAEKEAARRRAEEAARIAAEKARQEAERRRIEEEKRRLAEAKARAEAERERRFVESVCENAVGVQLALLRQQEQQTFAMATVVDLPPGEVTDEQLPERQGLVLRLTAGTYSFRKVRLWPPVRIRGAGVGKTVIIGEIELHSEPVRADGKRPVISVSGVDFRPYEEDRPENFEGFWRSFGRACGIGSDVVPTRNYLSVRSGEALMVRNCRFEGYGLLADRINDRFAQSILAVEECQFEHPYAKIQESAIRASGARVLARKCSFRCGADADRIFGRRVIVEKGGRSSEPLPAYFFAEDCKFRVVNLEVEDNSRVCLKNVTFSEGASASVSASASAKWADQGQGCPKDWLLPEHFEFARRGSGKVW